MEREKIIELAQKSGFDVSTTAGILKLGIDTGDDWFSCREEVLELIRLVEQETLERAAKKCDEVAESWIDESNKDTARPLIEECAFEIRNLKETHE